MHRQLFFSVPVSGTYLAMVDTQEEFGGIISCKNACVLRIFVYNAGTLEDI